MPAAFAAGRRVLCCVFRSLSRYAACVLAAPTAMAMPIAAQTDSEDAMRPKRADPAQVESGQATPGPDDDDDDDD